jgi:hypothetical protein
MRTEHLSYYFFLFLSRIFIINHFFQIWKFVRALSQDVLAFPHPVTTPGPLCTPNSCEYRNHQFHSRETDSSSATWRKLVELIILRLFVFVN